MAKDAQEKVLRVIVGFRPRMSVLVEDVFDREWVHVLQKHVSAPPRVRPFDPPGNTF